MFQESIIYKIFLRYLKEKNMLACFFKCNKKDFLKNTEKRIISDNNSLLFRFSLYNNPKPYFNDINFNDFCGNRKNNIEFNIIILYAMKPYIKEFLIKEGILKIFLKNLCKHNDYIRHLIPQEKAIKKNTDLILDTYIDYLAFQHEPIFQFLNRAFSFWSVSEDYDLWCELHSKFNDYIMEKLLSKCERKKIPYLKKLFLELHNNIISLIK